MEPLRDEEEMRAMPFLDHLAELRSRILKAVAGLTVAFAISLTLSGPLWRIVKQPAAQALQSLGYSPNLHLIDPMDGFNIIWMKLPVVTAIFLSAPWILYQLWAFVSPGLYRDERKWIAPFLISAGVFFVLGGVFAYFVLFRNGLTFLLGIGRGEGMDATVSMNHYFDLFVNVVLGVGVMFELPMLILALTALGLVTPRFLVRNARYVILAIFVLAAVITQTGDAVNLILLAGPMCALFTLGVAASYLLTRHREERSMSTRTKALLAIAASGLGAGGYFAWRRFRTK